MPRLRVSDAEHPAYDPGDVGPEGRPFCRWCLHELPERRRDFCGPQCLHEFKLRVSAGYARQQVFARDRGVCSHCRLDGGRLDRVIAALRERTEDGGRDDGVAVQTLAELGFGRRKRVVSVWNMDHRTAVVEGGGGCGLGNLRTLCLICHGRETRALHQRQTRRRGGVWS
jgi:5-methylcytosine-specific restriction protein A